MSAAVTPRSAPGPAPAPTLRPRVLTAAIAVALVAAGGLLLRTSAIDLPVTAALNGLRTGAVGTVADAVYRGVGPIPAVVGTAVLTAIVLLVRRDLRLASTFAVTIAVTWLSSALVKLVVGRPRPELALLPHPPALQPDASYPSGHMAFVTALVVTAVVVTRAAALRRVWVVAGAILLVGLAFCLLVEGVHFPTDVAASAVWSIGVAPLVAALWVRLVRPRRRAG